jgi:hypothetical protein
MFFEAFIMSQKFKKRCVISTRYEEKSYPGIRSAICMVSEDLSLEMTVNLKKLSINRTDHPIIANT